MKTNIFRLKVWISICFLSSIVLLMSCDKDHENIQESTEIIEELSQEEHIQELAFPNKTGEVVDINYDNQNLKAEKIDGLYVYEGDIIITEEDLQNMQKSTGRTSRYWPNCTVYYSIESSLPNKQRVYNAIAHWEQHTNFKFEYPFSLIIL